MELYIELFFSFAGAAIGLAVGYYWRGWEDRRNRQAQEQEQLEQRISEPEPAKPARTNYSAVHCMDQVDAMIERLDQAEIDEVIEEMQVRGW